MTQTAAMSHIEFCWVDGFDAAWLHRQCSPKRQEQHDPVCCDHDDAFLPMGETEQDFAEADHRMRSSEGQPAEPCSDQRTRPTGEKSGGGSFSTSFHSSESSCCPRHHLGQPLPRGQLWSLPRTGETSAGRSTRSTSFIRERCSSHFLRMTSWRSERTTHAGLAYCTIAPRRSACNNRNNPEEEFSTGAHAP